MSRSILFAAVIALTQVWIGQALQIRISPGQIDLITPTPINITCIPNTSLDNVVQLVTVLEIKGKDGQPIAVFKSGSDTPVSPVNGNGSRDVKVQGHIDKVPSKSFLKLTIPHPEKEDAGLYECVMFCLDNSGDIQQIKASGTLAKDSLDINAALEYLGKKVSNLDNELKTQAEYMTEKADALQNRLSELEGNLQTEIVANGYANAFSARYSETLDESVGSTIVFNDVIMKVGQGYDEKTGVYTAPKHGVYGFHLTFMTGRSYGSMALGVYVNGRRVALISADSNTKYFDQSTNTVFVELEVKDVVKVAVSSKDKDMTIQPFQYTSFTGYLYKEIHDNNNNNNNNNN